MEGLRSSVYSLAIISVSVGIIDIFSGFGNLKKYAKYIVSLVVVCALLVPVRSMFLKANVESFDRYLGDITEDEDHSSGSYTASLEMGLKTKISDYFSLPLSTFSVEIETEKTQSEVIITDIKTVITEQRYFHLCEKIEAYLKSSFGCNVTVVQNFGE